MKRICKYCGREYEGDSGSTACPECVAERKKTTIRERVCRQCGRTFPGGPRAWYCPECRAERSREAMKRHKRNGTVRPLGSTDWCEVCGAEYVVNSARQRYCPKCAEAAVRKKDRQQSIEWNKANITAEQRKEERKNATAMIPCAVCGKLFRPQYNAKTCSVECCIEAVKQRQTQYEKDNRESRNAYRRERNQKRKEGTTNMTKEQIIVAAQVFAKLEGVLKKQNTTDVGNAAAYPIRGMTLYIKEAADRGLLTDELNRYIAEAMDNFSVEDYQGGAEKHLTIEEMGIWQLAYYKTKNSI